MAREGELLFGRRTYEDFAAVWPQRANNPFTEVLNNIKKHVVSRTLSEPLAWPNSALLAGDADKSVAALKASPGLTDSVVTTKGVVISTYERLRSS